MSISDTSEFQKCTTWEKIRCTPESRNDRNREKEDVLGNG